MKVDFDKLSSDKNIDTGELIDMYSRIAIKDLQNNITKMINHDVVCNRKNLNCIIDNEINNRMLKKDFKKEILKENLSSGI